MPKAKERVGEVWALDGVGVFVVSWDDRQIVTVDKPVFVVLASKREERSVGHDVLMLDGAGPGACYVAFESDSQPWRHNARGRRL